MPVNSVSGPAPELWGSEKAAERWTAKNPQRHVEILLGLGGS
jgi:hypothetical protein